MAYDTAPMDAVFPACVDVLKDVLTPIHYAALTEHGLSRIGLSKRDVNWKRQIEDVREKLAAAGRFDLFYTGKALGSMVGIRWWFETTQLRLLHPTSGIIIPGNASSGANGAFEALMRDPYYLTKTNTTPERRARGRANGLVTEAHVVEWFKKTWPEFFIEPDNKNKWVQHCDHDFKLNVDGKIYKVDVSGKRLAGTFGNPGKGKKHVDFHLLCEIQGENILWRDVRSGADYQGNIFPEGGIWPERMVVWLNCAKNNIDYAAIKNHVASSSSPKTPPSQSLPRYA